MVFIVAFVGYAEITEGDVTYNCVKKAVGDIRFLKRLSGNRGTLIELLCDTCGNLINLHTVNTAVLHTLRQHTDKVTDTAGRLQNVAFLKAHLFHSLVNG